MIKWFLLILCLYSFSTYGLGRSLPLSDYLAHLYTHHPHFQAEQLTVDMAKTNQQHAWGQTNWVASITPSWSDTYPIQSSPLSPQSLSQQTLVAQLNKPIWTTGGQFTLAHTTNYIKKTTAPMTEQFNFTGPDTFYTQSVHVHYAHALLKNQHGIQSKLPYHLAQHDTHLAELKNYEANKNFIATMAQHYLEWVYLHDQSVLIQKRYQLAQTVYAQTYQKHAKHVVNDVDLLRAKTQVLQTKKDYETAQANRMTKQRFLAPISHYPLLTTRTPTFNLYQLPILKVTSANFYVLKELDQQLHRLNTQRDAAQNRLSPDLHLIVSGTWHDGNEHFKKATAYDHMDKTIALNYTHPLGQTQNKATIKALDYHYQYVIQKRTLVHNTLMSQKARLESHYDYLVTHYQHNQASIHLAKKTVEEETRLYEQGRNPFTFVLQAQDNEQQARLNLLTTAYQIHQCYLQYHALVDTLDHYIQSL